MGHRGTPGGSGPSLCVWKCRAGRPAAQSTSGGGSKVCSGCGLDGQWGPSDSVLLRGCLLWAGWLATAHRCGHCASASQALPGGGSTLGGGMLVSPASSFSLSLLVPPPF